MEKTDVKQSDILSGQLNSYGAMSRTKPGTVIKQTSVADIQIGLLNVFFEKTIASMIADGATREDIDIAIEDMKGLVVTEENEHKILPDSLIGTSNGLEKIAMVLEFGRAMAYEKLATRLQGAEEQEPSTKNVDDEMEI